MKLTATIIARNEEEKLPKAISSIKNLVDEVVIVVDPRTSDKTREVGQKLGAKCYLRDFDNFENQKNFAKSQARGEWILSLDADEEIPLALAKEIKKAIQSNEFDGYLIPRRNFLLGREIKYTRWSPDKHIWLFKRDRGRWAGEIHEEVELKGEIGELENAKIHHSYKTVTDFMNMVNSYTELEAKRKAKNGERFNFFKMIFDAKKSFIGRYFYKMGFLDGWQGFALSYMMAIYRLTTWVKVWEKSHA